MCVEDSGGRDFLDLILVMRRWSLYGLPMTVVILNTRSLPCLSKQILWDHWNSVPLGELAHTDILKTEESEEGLLLKNNDKTFLRNT